MARETLFPEIKPYNHGYLKAGNIHEIYYEECGNPKGFPIIFIHSGPGDGCKTEDRRYFNPEKWRIILYDQRGCGRSRPLGSLDDNNTWTLVSDIWYLSRRLGIEKFVLWGNSWGTLLALIFAIERPSKVAGMILNNVSFSPKKISAFDLPETKLIEDHYIEHNFFIGEEDILAKADRVAHIPTAIIQGIYDQRCINYDAIMLHNALPKSTLHLIYSPKDSKILKRLIFETENMFELVTKKDQP